MARFALRPLLRATLLFAVLVAKTVHADLSINFAEDGIGNVIASFSGFLNTAPGLGAPIGPVCFPNGDFDPLFFCLGPALPLDLFSVTGPPGLTFAPGAVATGPTASMGPGNVLFDGINLLLPTGYASGTAISGSSTFTGASLLSLGINGATGTIGTWSLLDAGGMNPVPPLPGGGGVLITLSVTPFSASASGDPHFKTWIGKRYDYHGECDLVLVSSEKFASGIGLDIHIRTTIRDDWSYISGVAMRIGDEVFELHSFGKYYMNGVEGADLPKTFAGLHLSHKVQKKRPERFIFSGEGLKVDLRVRGHYVAVNIENPTLKSLGDAVGLMGAFETGAWLLRDGQTAVTDPIQFGNEWQVRDHEHQLFVEEGPIKWPETCRLPDPTKVARRRLEESSISMEDAEEACVHWIENKDICIQDVLLTGDLDIAEAGVY